MIVLAVVLLLLVLIALIPVGVRAAYDDGAVQLQIAAGPVRLTLYPPKAKNERREAKKQKRLWKQRRKLEKKREKAAQKPRKTAEDKKLSPDEWKAYLALVLDFIKGLPRKLLVRQLVFHVTFGGSDAASTAIHYGRAWAVIGAAVPILENNFRIQARDIDARLDYTKETIQIYACLDLRMRIGTGLLLAGKAGVRFLKILMQKKKKAVQTNESSSL